jgi:hypothetical protein
MDKLIFITGVDQLSPAERWPRLIAPLAEKLKSSGLGRLPDEEALRREAEQTGVLEATEVAVQLANLDYGRPLVDSVVAVAGIHCLRSSRPARWRSYHCDDYFASTLAEFGSWDDASQLWLVWPADRVYERPDEQFLVIGTAGVNGIHWGYRGGQRGLWAYPIDGEFVWKASSAAELVQGWLSGTIVV